MTISNLLVQAVGLLGTCLYFLSFQCKKNQKLFQIQLASYLCYTAHMLLLGAVTGGISYILNMFRSFCLGSNIRFLKSKTMCAILCALQVVAMLLTWSGWVSVLPVAANIASTLAGYTFNGKNIRLAGLCVNAPLWIIYDAIVGSWAGILDEVITSVSVIISILRFGVKALDHRDE